MNRFWLLAGAGAGTLFLVVSAILTLQRIHRQQRLIVRVQMSQGRVPLPIPARQAFAKNIWMRVIVAFGQMILRTGLVSARTRSELELTLASVGLHARNSLEIFIGSKIALLLGLPSLAMMMLRGVSLPSLVFLVIPAAAALIGLLLPDLVVRYRRRRYLQRVERGLPDALDLLVICSQAGLGLTTAIIRVAEEMKIGRQDIGLELALTAHDLQFMADGRQALLNMGSRTGIDGLIRLGTTLVQSMQYGTPLSQSMRGLSAEMRQDTLIRFENKAARIGVLMTLPMVVFILPCVFLVVGGPAAIQVMHVGSQ